MIFHEHVWSLINTRFLIHPLFMIFKVFSVPNQFRDVDSISVTQYFVCELTLSCDLFGDKFWRPGLNVFWWFSNTISKSVFRKLIKINNLWFNDVVMLNELSFSNFQIKKKKIVLKVWIYRRASCLLIESVLLE